MEEVGFDMKDRAFEDQYLERELNGQIVRLYIVKQVPRETKFVSKTKNEIKVSRRLSFDLNTFEVFFPPTRKCVGFKLLIYHLIDVIQHHK
jgi:hypothetical protein